MTKLQLIFILVVFYAASNAQVTTSPTLVACSGGYVTGPNVSLSYTIGETIGTTAIVGNNILTQGFQQPSDIINGIEQPFANNGNVIALYPIPATNTLSCVYSFASSGKVIAEIHNLWGQGVSEQEISNYINGIQTDALNVSQLAAGDYYLTLTHISVSGKVSNTTKSFSVIR